MLIGPLSHAACAFDTTGDDLQMLLEAAEAAFAELDVAGFQRTSTEIDFVVPCLKQPLDPEGAARLHRVRGLGAFANGDEQRATAALQAARSLEPNYVFSEGLLPQGVELRVRYEGLDPEVHKTSRLPRPRGGVLWIDGARRHDWPTGQAILLQRTEGDIVVQTVYLEPTEPLPAYPGVRRAQGHWLVASAATAILGGVAYGLAWQSRSALGQVTPDWTNDDLARIQTRTNVLTGVSIGLEVLAGGQLAIAAGKAP